MPAVTKDDREDLSTLVGLPGPGPPRHHRDASQMHPWKKPPTNITVPTTNSRHWPSAVPPNPYNSAVLNHTNRHFGGKSRGSYGNRTMQQVITRDVSSQPPLKKRKVCVAKPAPSTGSSSLTIKGKGKERVPVATDDDIQILDRIQVDSEDEDLGVPYLPGTGLSSDPLDSFNGPSHASTSTSLFDELRGAKSGSSATASVKAPPDGQSTARLRKKLGKEIEVPEEAIVVMSDDIEQFSDDARESRQVQGFVKQRVTEIDNNAGGPRVNFKDLQSKKNAMKPKKGLKDNPADILTTRTPFVNGNASSSVDRTITREPKEKEILIDTLYIGLQKMDQSKQPARLSWSSKPAKIHLHYHQQDRSSPVDSHFAVDRDMAAIYHTASSNTYALQLKTCKGPKSEPPYFVRGDANKGCLTIRFDPKQADISTKYVQFIDLLKSSISGPPEVARGQKSSDSFWEAKCRSLNLEFQRVSESRTGNKAIPSLARMKPASKRKADELDHADGPVHVLPEGLKPAGKLGATKIQDTAAAAAASHDTAPLPPPPLRRSARQSGARAEDSGRTSPLGDSDEVILVYPPATTGAVAIKNSDLMRLQPGEYLNDTLIEFGLKLWLKELEDRSPDFAKTVHVFSSFFYKKLNKRNLDEGYQSVKKWTSKIDLFEKKYVIIPINENMHWYLAVIYKPEYVLEPPPIVETPKSMTTRRRARDSAAANATPAISRNPSPVSSDQTKSSEEDLAMRTESMVITPSQLETHRPPRSSLATVNGKPAPVPDTESLAGLLGNNDEEEMVGGGPSGRPSSPLSDVPDSEPVMPVDETVRDEPSPFVDVLGEDSTTATSWRSRESSVRSMEAVENELDMANHDDMSVDIFDTSLDKDSGGPSVAVPIKSFYGQDSAKGKVKISQATDDVLTMDVDPPEDEVQVVDRPTTYIITFDSLGSRHPKVVNTLSQYLKMEAKDKKGYEYELTSAAHGLQALVPAQPNFCDCGVYLLHFAQTFMKDPEKYVNLIKGKQRDHAQRRVEWEDEKVGTFREHLSMRIKELSAAWKKERESKLREEEAQKREAAAKKVAMQGSLPSTVEQAQLTEASHKKDIAGGSVTPTPSVPVVQDSHTEAKKIVAVEDDSDDDVEVVEVLKKSPPRHRRNGEGMKKATKKQSKAGRLR